MKIVIYGINYAPELTGIGKYSGEMAAWLAKKGHEVRVVTAPPYYPDWRVPAPYSCWHYRVEQLGDIKVFRAPLYVPREATGKNRVLHLLSFAITSLPVILAQSAFRPDVVLTVAPALTCAPGGWLAARLCGASAWLHIQDFEVDVAFNMGLMQGGVLKKSVLALERFVLRQFDCVSTISFRMRELLRKKGVEQGKVASFPNWVDIRHIHRQSGPNSYREQLGIAADTKVILFSGTLNSKQGLEVIPAIARQLNGRSDILFIIGGDGQLKTTLQDFASDLKNVLFLPLQPASRMSDWLGMADIHLLPQNAHAQDLVLPSKLTGMLASGRPVVAVCHAETEMANIVAGCGVAVAPGNEAWLLHAIVSLADDAALRERLGCAAREYAETHLSIDAVMGDVVARMHSIKCTDLASLTVGKP